MHQLKRTQAWHPALLGGGEPTLAAVPFQAHGCDPEKHFRKAVRQNKIEVVSALKKARVIEDVGQALQSPSFDGDQLSEEMKNLLTSLTRVPKSAIDE
ncbi:MAG: hypothetical protein ChlgKO_11490 [Chlamydiales bacterium]